MQLHLKHWRLHNRFYLFEDLINGGRRPINLLNLIIQKQLARIIKTIDMGHFLFSNLVYWGKFCSWFQKGHLKRAKSNTETEKMRAKWIQYSYVGYFSRAGLVAVSKDPKFTTCNNVFFGLVKPNFALGIPSLSPNPWSFVIAVSLPIASCLLYTILSQAKCQKKCKYKPDRPTR